MDRTQDDTIRDKTGFAEVSWGITDQWKLTLGGRRYDICDLQLSEQATSGSSSFPYTGNAGRATVKGVELEREALPLAGLQLGAYFNYDQAELAGDIPNPTKSLVGDPIPYVPKTTFSLTSNYEWPLGVREISGTVGACRQHSPARPLAASKYSESPPNA